MKKRTGAVLLLLAVLLYLVMFPRPLRKEMIFVPRWNLDLAGPMISDASDSGDVFPFIVPDGSGREYLGSVSGDGRLLYREPVYYRAAVSSRGYINYSSSGGDLITQDPRGNILEKHETEGFPLLTEDRFLVISRDRKGISRWDWSGGQLWNFHFGSLITGLDIRSGGILLGFLNGDVSLLSDTGTELFHEVRRGTAVYGCALSESEPFYATISELDPQILRLFTYTDGGSQLVWEKPLEDSYRTGRRIFFSDDGRLLHVEIPGGLALWDLQGRQIRKLSFAGTVGEVRVPGEGALGLYWQEGPGSREMVLLDPYGNYRVSRSFGPDGRLLRKDDRGILVSRKGQIFRLDRELN